MQTSPVLATAHRSDEVKKISPARQLRLDARRKDAAVWTAPKRYLKTTPFFAFVRDFHNNDSLRTPAGPDNAWANMTPDERLPYVTQLDPDNIRYRMELQAFNARIPLSPLVDIGPSSTEPRSDSDSDSSGVDANGSPSACRELGGYGDCFEHRPGQGQRVNRRAA
ncbi:MAG: hypothetical protein Q9226_007693 [Calogaya cf. arnoldii]